jgi:hypothetical protein
MYFIAIIIGVIFIFFGRSLIKGGSLYSQGKGILVLIGGIIMVFFSFLEILSRYIL